NAGSDLTANHIVQGALVIGGTANNPGVVTIAASDSAGSPLGQSNGLALASSLAPSGPFDIGVSSLAASSSIAAGKTDMLPLSTGNSTLVGNASVVPEPSTLLMALLAALGVVSSQFMRHQFRWRTL